MIVVFEIREVSSWNHWANVRICLTIGIYRRGQSAEQQRCKYSPGHLDHDSRVAWQCGFRQRRQEPSQAPGPFSQHFWRRLIVGLPRSVGMLALLLI